MATDRPALRVVFAAVPIALLIPAYRAIHPGTPAVEPAPVPA